MDTSKEKLLHTLSKQLQEIGEITMTQNIIDVLQKKNGIEITIAGMTGNDIRDLPEEVRKTLIEKSKKDFHRKPEFAKEEMAANIYLYLIQKYGFSNYSKVISSVINIVYPILYEGVCTDVTTFLMGTLHLNRLTFGSIEGEPWMHMATLIITKNTKELLEWAKNEILTIKLKITPGVKLGQRYAEYLSALIDLVANIGSDTAIAKFPS